MADVLKGAEPFRIESEGKPAVLVLHGFTGSTQSMRYMGEELHRRFGFSVYGPRLKGHGTSPDDFATTGYLDWLRSAEDALHALSGGKKKVFVTGLSMGGTICLNLAARFPDIVAGLVSVNGCGGKMGAEISELISSRDAPDRIPGIGSDIKAEGVVELAYQEVPVTCLRDANTTDGRDGKSASQGHMPDIGHPVTRRPCSSAGQWPDDCAKRRINRCPADMARRFLSRSDTGQRQGSDRRAHRQVHLGDRRTIGNEFVTGAVLRAGPASDGQDGYRQVAIEMAP